MTKIISLIALLLIVPSLSRADDSNSVRILVAKAGDTTAKVTIGTQTYLVPIEFEAMMQLGWDDVKDGYHLPPAYVSLLKQGRIRISITCSGTSFIVVRAHQSK